MIAHTRSTCKQRYRASFAVVFSRISFIGMRVSSLCLLLYLLSSSNCIELHLTTSDEGYVTVIQGFAAELECTLNTCVRHSASVSSCVHHNDV
ncbi:hypothetical protein AB6A40_010699 [Gnathostoma spinigerum]|uniref:Secreted protein n=1 Tax=Gnathostoma spinigerum TaxID=75299 RepID=A0ABD6EVK5_9BILA